MLDKAIWAERPGKRYRSGQREPHKTLRNSLARVMTSPFRRIRTAGPPRGKWSVYVHAHQDDWQLFESPNAYDDYQTGNNLLIIYTTAGDEGKPTRWWKAREQGAKASVRWMTGQQAEGAGWTDIYYKTSGSSHRIRIWTYGRVTSVFMRLPDSNTDGSGFAATGFAGLAKLRDGTRSSLKAVDRSTTYDGWTDFCMTLKAIITRFTPYDSTTWINSPDFDRSAQTSQGLNCPFCPNHPDHSDHLATADAVRAITVGKAAPWSSAVFVDYPISHDDDPRYPINLGDDERRIKRDLFKAYNHAVRSSTGVNEYGGFSASEENCFQREYFRIL